MGNKDTLDALGAAVACMQQMQVALEIEEVSLVDFVNELTYTEWRV